jgi:hypothetical protein
VKIQQRRELPVLKSVSGGEYFDMRATWQIWATPDVETPLRGV